MFSFFWSEMKPRLETYIFAQEKTEGRYKVTTVTPDLDDDKRKEAKRKLSERLYDIFIKYEKSNK